MPKLREILTCSALAALTCLLICATAAVCLVAEVVSRLPREINGAILETRAQVLGQLADAERDILGHLTALTSRADTRLGSIQADAHLELAATRELVTAQLGSALGRVDQALAEVHGLRLDAQPILEHVGSVTKQIDDSAGLYLDCESNPSCMYNRVQGTSKAIEKAAQNVGAMSTEMKLSLPSALLTWQQIGGNVNQTSANVARITKPHWYDNLIKGLAAGATVGAVLK